MSHLQLERGAPLQRGGFYLYHLEEAQLLSHVILFFISPLFASLDVNRAIQDIQAVQPSFDHISQACEIKNTSEQIIKERRHELLGNTSQNTDFFVFVSSSIHQDHLLQLGNAAKKHGGVLVLRGLVHNSFKETTQERSYLFKEGIGVLIDPQLFEDHGIQHVPVFILTNGRYKDQISGSISPEYALKSFAQSGDLSPEAVRRLNP